MSHMSQIPRICTRLRGRTPTPRAAGTIPDRPGPAHSGPDPWEATTFSISWGCPKMSRNVPAPTDSFPDPSQDVPGYRDPHGFTPGSEGGPDALAPRGRRDARRPRWESTRGAG